MKNNYKPLYITLHWTAGNWTPNYREKRLYHDLFDHTGKHIKGFFNHMDNVPANGRYLIDGFDHYAAHCGGGNSFRIGKALCGMLGYVSPFKPGDRPITRKSFESACKSSADDCKRYGIKIAQEYVGTHYEFGKAHPKSSSYGKIDIIFLPWEPQLKANEIGDYYRDKVRWYHAKL